MWLIKHALAKPITTLVIVLAVVLSSIMAVNRMPVDIFPNLNLPVIYVAQPYGGMDPAQMESYLVSYYEYHFLYIAGIEHVESRSIQNVGLVKLYFHPGTDMSQALAQTISYVERARAFMPPGTVSPFVVRFDAGSVPVGQLVFSSDTRAAGEIQDLALFRVRPVFSTLPGVSAPPPFGGNQRTVIVRADPTKLRQLNMSPDELAKAVAAGNTILPAGNVRTGDLNRMALLNSVVRDIRELADLPVRSGSGANVFVRDVAEIENGSDILTGYGNFNGRRTVYIPVTKRSDASTLDVVNRVRSELPRFQSLVPDDIRISFEFDQSTYVTNALKGLIGEGLIGALLTGLMVLLFLRDLRSALIVLATIPCALLASVTGLWLTGQTINIMTLGGLALAIGILVDESTVAIENIHSHLARREPLRQAVLAASRETLTPRLLALLSVLAVFAPSFFMVGVPRSLFIPLSISVGFAMLASYCLSNSLVPILASAILRSDKHWKDSDTLRRRYGKLISSIYKTRWIVLPVYLVACALIIWFGFRQIGTDIFPRVDTGQFQLRLRAPAGTRVERTEVLTLKAIDAIKAEAGVQSVSQTLGYIGTQPASYPINTIHLWTSGPHEAVLTVALRRDSGIHIEDLKERLRRKLSEALPGVNLSFEAGDIVTQIMNFGSPTPVEVAVSGANLAATRAFAEKLMGEMRKISILRDLQYSQPLDYPTVDIRIDRVRAGQMGVSVEQVGKSLVAATSSTRFIQPTYWRDPSTGTAYQVQVEIPQNRISSIEDVQNVPVNGPGASRVLAGDVAEVTYGTAVGEYDRYNQQRMVTITANISGADLGSAASSINKAIAAAGDPPKGVTVNIRGQVPTMIQTVQGLELGLLIAVIAIFLLLCAYFQSIRLPMAVLAILPAVVSGVVIVLVVTRTSLNIQSFMGSIMAIGVSVANAILQTSIAEEKRKISGDSREAAIEGASMRLRAILMTSVTMIAGMLPMALGLGEGGEQTAPLGRAVIGGLLFSTVAVTLVLPLFFGIFQRNASIRSNSLLPDEEPLKGAQ